MAMVNMILTVLVLSLLLIEFIGAVKVDELEKKYDAEIVQLKTIIEEFKVLCVGKKTQQNIFLMWLV